MKLRLVLIVVCAVAGLNGSQPPTKNENALQEALKQTIFGNPLVIFCDSNRQPVVNECKKALKEFRKNEEQNIMDYLVLGAKMHGCLGVDVWVECPTNIQELVDKDFYSTGYQRGLVLYGTTLEDKKPIEQYVNEIQSLKKAGWSVLMNLHDAQLVEELDKKYLGSKSFWLRGTKSDTTFLKKLLLVSGVVFVIVFLYTKFDVLKNKFA